MEMGSFSFKVARSIMENLKRGLAPFDIKLETFEALGVHPDAKEAVLFAVLGNECLAGNPANMRSVTGSTKSVILGKICQA